MRQRPIKIASETMEKINRYNRSALISFDAISFDIIETCVFSERLGKLIDDRFSKGKKKKKKRNSKLNRDQNRSFNRL